MAGAWAATGAGSGAGCTGGDTTSTGLIAGGGGGIGFEGAASADRPLDDTTRFGLLDTTAGVSSAGAASEPAAARAAFFRGGFLVDTAAGFSSAAGISSAGSSTSDGGLISPSRLAFRRTRSA